MISIPPPSMALNSADFRSRDHYTLTYNAVIPSGMIVQDIVSSVATAAASAGGRLNCLVVNSHGMGGDCTPGACAYGPAGVALGTGISLVTAEHFHALQGQIGVIYLCGCEAASTDEHQRFCWELARQTGALVVASEAPQVITAEDRAWTFSLVMAAVPENCIDDFEGRTWNFFPDGGRTRFSRNGSVVPVPPVERGPTGAMRSRE